MSIFAIALAIAAGCVDQPLIPVSGSGATGGASVAGGTMGTSAGGSAGGILASSGGTSMGGWGGDSTSTGGTRHTTASSGGVPGFGGATASVGGRPGFCWARSGDECGSPWDCCDGLACRDKACRACAQQSEGCRSNSDCCSGICNSKGRCGDAGDSCFVEGTPCVEPDLCCSGQCFPSSTPGMGSICAAVDGCQPLGESCMNNAACCSGLCSPQTFRCEAALTCHRRGERCDAKVKDRTGCCNEEQMTVACREDSGGFVERCTASTCKSGSDPCFHAAECCNSAGQKPKLCLYGPNFTSLWGRCVSCGMAKWGCTVNSDCCTGLACDNYGPTGSFTCFDASNFGTGGTSGSGTSTEACIPVNGLCNVATGSGGAPNSTNPCCGSAFCDMNSTSPKCVQK